MVMVWFFSSNIVKPEAHSEASQILKIELSAKKVNS